MHKERATERERERKKQKEMEGKREGRRRAEEREGRERKECDYRKAIVFPGDFVKTIFVV